MELFNNFSWSKPKPKTDTIFIQIASYRDPELLPTLKDLFDKATYPDNLRVCVAWQHDLNDEWDTVGEFANDSRVKILDINYKESSGVCWARNQVQQHYSNETYTLQLDSHHRFEPGWDITLIEMIKQLQAKGHQKPLLTGYIPSFNPKNDPEERATHPWKMNFDRFTPEGVIFFLPAAIDNYKELNEPIPSRFYSAHFAFTLGQFAKEVQHDPEFYFHGEEITLAVRAFTHGYDLFHPHRKVAYHEYTRDGRTKQWDDDPTWTERNTLTHQKVRKLLGVDGEVCTSCNRKSFGNYWLGTERTIEDYERYTGIRFKDRGVQQYTLNHELAPNPVVEDFDNSFEHKFRHCIDLYAKEFKENDYDLWVISFEMNDGTVISRQDADENEINQLLEVSKSDGDWIRLWREYNGQKPDKWVVWAHSKSKGWCERKEHDL